MKIINYLSVAILNYFAAICFILAGILANGLMSLILFLIAGAGFIVSGSINLRDHIKMKNGSSS